MVSNGRSRKPFGLQERHLRRRPADESPHRLLNTLRSLRRRRARRVAEEIQQQLGSKLGGQPAGILLAAAAHALFAWGTGSMDSDASGGCVSESSQESFLLKRLRGMASETWREGATLAQEALETSKQRTSISSMVGAMRAVSEAYAQKVERRTLSEIYSGLYSISLRKEGHTRAQEELLAAFWDGAKLGESPDEGAYNKNRSWA